MSEGMERRLSAMENRMSSLFTNSEYVSREDSEVSRYVPGCRNDNGKERGE